MSAITIASFAAGSSAVAVERSEYVSGETTISLVDFDHPVSLPDAATIRTANSQDVIGYRFDSDSMVGDFWVDTNQSLASFLEDVETKTGTVPEVTGAYLEVPQSGKEGDRLRHENDAVVIETGLPEFDAPDASPEAGLLEVRGNEDGSRAESSSVTARANTNTWRPNDAEGMVEDLGASVMITAKYSWYGVDPFASPLETADHWGMEFEFSFHTAMRTPIVPAAPPYVRPNCGRDDFKDWAAASNRYFNWFAMVAYGQDFVYAPGALGLYGDYNDLWDECTRTSVSVGMAVPHAMPSSIVGTNHLTIVMYPDRGQDTQSRLGANIQLVERYTCEQFPSIALTDCMGGNVSYQYPSGSVSRMVLNAFPSGRPAPFAPNYCWYSGNFGNDAAQPWDCNAVEG